jgi:CubicO group peptidase (beta-lactamase class C family)
MDSARLVEAATYALTGGGAGMVVRYGKLVHQWGDTGIDIDTRVDIKSTTKSIGSIALGIAIDQQKVALGDTAASRYANFGKDPADLTPPDATWLSQITLQQLATHTSGFEKDRFSTADLVNAPGTKWMYSDGGLNWLADTLTNVFQQDLNLILRESVWRPLEITTDDLTWRNVSTRPVITDSAGAAVPLREFAAGVTANANAMARIGLLFLRKGMWKDQRILSEAFVQTASTPQAATATAELVDPAGFPSANEGYGVMWWTNATGQLPDVPRDAYWAWGLGDSLIVVIPSLDLVIARVGDHPDSGTKEWRGDWNGNYEVLRPFLTPIVQSVTP